MVGAVSTAAPSTASNRYELLAQAADTEALDEVLGLLGAALTPGILAAHLEAEAHHLQVADWAELLAILYPDDYPPDPPLPAPEATRSRLERVRLLTRRDDRGLALWNAQDRIRLGEPWTNRNGVPLVPRRPRPG
jgi:hypothetical protein